MTHLSGAQYQFSMEQERDVLKHIVEIQILYTKRQCQTKFRYTDSQQQSMKYISKYLEHELEDIQSHGAWIIGVHNNGSWSRQSQPWNIEQVVTDVEHGLGIHSFGSWCIFPQPYNMEQVSITLKRGLGIHNHGALNRYTQPWSMEQGYT